MLNHFHESMKLLCIYGIGLFKYTLIEQSLVQTFLLDCEYPNITIGIEVTECSDYIEFHISMQGSSVVQVISTLYTMKLS